MITPGDTCIMRCPRGELAIYLPDGRRLPLDGAQVTVLSKTSLGRAAMYEFRPIPWDFPPGAYPDRWQAVAEYFERATPC